MGAAKPAMAEPAAPARAPSAWQTRRDYSRVPVTLPVALSALTEAETAATLEPSKPGTPYQTGIGREIPDAYRGDLAKSVRWAPLPGGGQVASFSVRSPGAHAVRLALRAILPDGGVVRFFQPGTSDTRYRIFKPGDFVDTAGADHEAPASAASTSRLRWSPTISGDTVGIEVEIPDTASAADVVFHVERASHIWQSPAAAPPQSNFQRKITHDCEPIVPIVLACKTTPACPREAVARITFTEADGRSYLCSGTAINSGRSEFDNFDNPYFLTAEHCIGSQRAAESVESTWRYEYETCAGSTPPTNHVELQRGAELLLSDPDVDGALLKLRDALPVGACLAGWNASAGVARDTPVTSIHHPGGRPKAWAGGNVDGTGVVGSEDGPSVDMIGVTWSEGGTEGGSSGSGLFATNSDGDDELIGMLSGGDPEDCSVDYYGRFDRFFRNGASTHLRPSEPLATDDHGDGAQSATGVLPDSTIGGKIDDGADADVFRIDLSAPGTLTVYTTGALDTYGRLKRQDGTTIAEGDDHDGSTNLNFRIVAEMDAGTYFIKVTGFNGEQEGSYRLHVEFDAKTAWEVLVPLFPAASEYEDAKREGFVRVTNRSDRSGEVRIAAIDDAGESAKDETDSAARLTLAIGANETRNFNSRDFEEVNPEKGLAGAVRLTPGKGDWRLRFQSELDIEVAAYIRTSDGFLTSIHDMVLFENDSGAFYVPIFNPASNTNQKSQLRLINHEPDRAVTVTINGYDDAGMAGESSVEIQLVPGEARTLDATAIESGRGVTGRFGDGKGKWRLFIEANGNLTVMNLLESPTGNLTNLSSPGGKNFD